MSWRRRCRPAPRRRTPFPPKDVEFHACRILIRPCHCLVFWQQEAPCRAAGRRDARPPGHRGSNGSKREWFYNCRRPERPDRPPPRAGSEPRQCPPPADRGHRRDAPPSPAIPLISDSYQDRLKQNRNLSAGALRAPRFRPGAIPISTGNAPTRRTRPAGSATNRGAHRRRSRSHRRGRSRE